MSRRLVNLGLYALTLAVAAAGVVLAVTSVRAEEPALPAEGDPDLYAAVLEAGADALVAGSAVFKGGSVGNPGVYGDNIRAIRAAAEGARKAA